MAVIASSGETSTGGFPTTGNSSSLVISLVDLEAGGLVVGKNDSETPRWVAVIPLWAVMEDVERVIGEEVEFCGEYCYLLVGLVSYCINNCLYG